MELSVFANWRRKSSEISSIEATEQDDSLLDERKSWVLQIEAAATEWERVGSELGQQEADALAEWETAKTTAERAQRKYLDTKHRMFQHKIGYDRIVSQAEAKLRATASPKIREFARQLEERRRNMTLDERRGSVAGERITTHSNFGSVQRAVARINAILCHELKALELKTLSNDELDVALANLAHTIPSVELEKVR